MAHTTSEEPAPVTTQRHQATRSIYVIDSAMTYLITVGGLGVIIAVLGIFVFILFQILPLFQGARVAALGQQSLPPETYAVLGADEWTEYPFIVSQNGQMTFLDTVWRSGLSRRRRSTLAKPA